MPFFGFKVKQTQLCSEYSYFNVENWCGPQMTYEIIMCCIFVVRNYMYIY